MSSPTPDQRLAGFQAIPMINIHDLLHGDALARRFTVTSDHTIDSEITPN